MPRPRKLRLTQRTPLVGYCKPQGVPLSELVEPVLPLDGLKAVRLADVEGLEQVDAAARMGISRPTFSRLVAEARIAPATALSQGWAIRIEGASSKRPPAAWNGAHPRGVGPVADSRVPPQRRSRRRQMVKKRA